MNAQELLASAMRAGVEILPSGMIRMPVVPTEETANSLVWLHIHGDELNEKSFEVLALLQKQRQQPKPVTESKAQKRAYKTHAALCFLSATLPCDRTSLFILAGMLGHTSQAIQRAARELHVFKGREWHLPPKTVSPALLRESFTPYDLPDRA